jgi:hypothetical protein
VNKISAAPSADSVAKHWKTLVYLNLIMNFLAKPVELASGSENRPRFAGAEVRKNWLQHRSLKLGE